MVDKVIGINGKPFDARDYAEENRKAVERMVFDMADDIDTGNVVPRGIAFMVLHEDGTPTFYFGGKETDTFLLYGSMEAMKTTFWDSVVSGGYVDYDE